MFCDVSHFIATASAHFSSLINSGKQPIKPVDQAGSVGSRVFHWRPHVFDNGYVKFLFSWLLMCMLFQRTRQFIFIAVPNTHSCLPGHLLIPVKAISKSDKPPIDME